MDLHGNVILFVQAAQADQQVGGVCVALFLGQRLTGHSLFESCGCLFGVGLHVRNIIQPVVRSAAAHLNKELQALFQSVDHTVGAGELAANNFFQLMDVIRKAVLADVQDLVRAEGRCNNNLDGGVFLDFLVPFQAVDGVIGGADHGNVALLDQAAHGHLGIMLQLIVAQVPDFLSGIAVQNAVVAKVLFQFQVAPGVHRVANGHFQCFCKLLEALAVRLVTGDVLFGHTVGTHHAPLIMVAEVVVRAIGQNLMAAQPYLSDIFKAAVLVDLLRGNVAVIVYDRQRFCIIMIQVLRGGGFQQEILVHKCFHNCKLLRCVLRVNRTNHAAPKQQNKT